MPIAADKAQVIRHRIIAAQEHFAHVVGHLRNCEVLLSDLELTPQDSKRIQLLRDTREEMKREFQKLAKELGLQSLLSGFTEEDGHG